MCTCILYACVQWPVLGDDLLSVKLDEKLKKKGFGQKAERQDGWQITLCFEAEHSSILSRIHT